VRILENKKVRVVSFKLSEDLFRKIEILRNILDVNRSMLIRMGLQMVLSDRVIREKIDFYKQIIRERNERQIEKKEHYTNEEKTFEDLYMIITIKRRKI
jgi:predicted transcriptional regulator